MSLISLSFWAIICSSESRCCVAATSAFLTASWLQLAIANAPMARINSFFIPYLFIQYFLFRFITSGEDNHYLAFGFFLLEMGYHLFERTSNTLLVDLGDLAADADLTVAAIGLCKLLEGLHQTDPRLSATRASSGALSSVAGSLRKQSDCRAGRSTPKPAQRP